MAYLLDANVFIAAKRLHYGFDFCPGYWDWLLQANQQKLVFCVERVVDELTGSKDDLSKWIKSNRKRLLMPMDQNAAGRLEQVALWANTRYTPDAVAQFLQTADFQLVGQALAGSHTVVTYEKPSDTVKRVKIPDVCRALNVPCISPFELLRTEKACLVLHRE